MTTPVLHTGQIYGIAEIPDPIAPKAIYTNGKQNFVLYEIYESAMHSILGYQTALAGEINLRAENTSSNCDYLTQTITDFNKAERNLKQHFDSATKVMKIAIVILVLIVVALAITVGILLIL